jgi:light-regulated signal transduction histidine kinase (bacteriophytochrome)
VADAEIRRLNEELERRVRDRTAQLQQTNRELATSNRELESFRHSVSHDLRAPLRAIDGFSMAVLEDYASELPEEGAVYLRRVRAASQRMGQLIDELLQLSRVSRAEMATEDVDLSALVHEIVAALREGEPARQVEVLVQDNVHAVGDPRLLRVVLVNLLDNAWKFTSKRQQATIWFGAEPEGEDLVYHVRDNGAGFDAAYASRLFAPFQRLHTADQFPGTGVGLATVQRIVRRHGGRVWAFGIPDEGATFSFTVARDSQGVGGKRVGADEDHLAGRGQPGRRRPDVAGVETQQHRQ